MKKAFYRGEINEFAIFSQYNRNRREAEEFSIFGYTLSDLKCLLKDTHNPLLKKRIEDVIEDRKGKGKTSLMQNRENLNKLEKFKEDALNIGLRKVLSRLRKYCKVNYNAGEANCRCGINDASGKNACYLVYSYLPDGTQLTWHSNNYYLYKQFSYVSDTWDGQVCMNMEKLITFLEMNYSQLF